MFNSKFRSVVFIPRIQPSVAAKRAQQYAVHRAAMPLGTMRKMHPMTVQRREYYVGCPTPPPNWTFLIMYAISVGLYYFTE